MKNAAWIAVYIVFCLIIIGIYRNYLEKSLTIQKDKADGDLAFNEKYLEMMSKKSQPKKKPASKKPVSKKPASKKPASKKPASKKTATAK